MRCGIYGRWMEVYHGRRDIGDGDGDGDGNTQMATLYPERLAIVRLLVCWSVLVEAAELMLEANNMPTPLLETILTPPNKPKLRCQSK
jgi:hypothetical protein